MKCKRKSADEEDVQKNMSFTEILRSGMRKGQTEEDYLKNIINLSIVEVYVVLNNVMRYPYQLHRSLLMSRRRENKRE